MLRFPNPGSDIDNIINIYVELFKELFELQPFSLDDISYVLTSKRLVSSSGFIGKEALKRSTRKDRSRDPMYNQSKMYAETFRFLGWLHPTNQTSLSYQFTYFGAHVTQILEDPKPFIRECLIGTVYPNEVLKIEGNYEIRPFYTILKSIKDLNGYMSRDEMIIGPLSINNDTDENEYRNMIEKISNLRKGSYDSFLLEYDKVRGSKGEIIADATKGNYTRIVLAALNWSDWTFTNTNKNHYGKSLKYFYLSDFGETYIEFMESLKDIRNFNPDSIDNENLIRLSFYQTLERGGFNIEAIKTQIDEDLLYVTKNIDVSVNYKNILFSPYQKLSSDKLTKYFPSLLPEKKELESLKVSKLNSFEHNTSLVNTIKINIENINTYKKDDFNFLNELIDEYKEKKDIEAIINAKIKDLILFNQKDFYPLIANLMKSLGFNCINPASGNNYMRYDALIIDESNSIPIEIKSPAEEQHISMKAIRQALENKIVMLSRCKEIFPTKKETSSLVVGYLLPNNRSEVEGLIKNINETYSFNIGVIDLYTLIKLAMLNSLTSNTFDKSILEKLNGYLTIKTI